MQKKPFAFCAVFLAVIALVLCRPHALFAQAQDSDHERRIVEPIITEETMPNEVGDWDLRLSGSHDWQGTGGSGFLPRAQLFFGIAERWGGEVEVPMAFAREDNNHYGIGDFSTTLKYLLRKPGLRTPGFVLALETKFPSGDSAKGLGEGVFEASPFLAVVQAWQRIVLQGNVGYSLVHKLRETDASNQMFYNAAVAFPLELWHTSLLWEINGAHAHDRNQVAFAPGVKYNLTPEWYLAIALPVGLNSQTPRLGIVVQLQIAVRSAQER